MNEKPKKDKLAGLTVPQAIPKVPPNAPSAQRREMRAARMEERGNMRAMTARAATVPQQGPGESDLGMEVFRTGKDLAAREQNFPAAVKQYNKDVIQPAIERSNLPEAITQYNKDVIQPGLAKAEPYVRPVIDRVKQGVDYARPIVAAGVDRLTSAVEDFGDKLPGRVNKALDVYDGVKEAAPGVIRDAAAAAGNATQGWIDEARKTGAEMNSQPTPTLGDRYQTKMENRAVLLRPGIEYAQPGKAPRTDEPQQSMRSALARNPVMQNLTGAVVDIASQPNIARRVGRMAYYGNEALTGLRHGALNAHTALHNVAGRTVNDVVSAATGKETTLIKEKPLIGGKASGTDPAAAPAPAPAPAPVSAGPATSSYGEYAAEGPPAGWAKTIGAQGVEYKGPQGNFMRSSAPAKSGGTFSVVAGPGSVGMSGKDWQALSNEEKIARNVAAYDAQRAAIKSMTDLARENRPKSGSGVTVIPNSHAREWNAKVAASQAEDSMRGLSPGRRAKYALGMAELQMKQQELDMKRDSDRVEANYKNALAAQALRPEGLSPDAMLTAQTAAAKLAFEKEEFAAKAGERAGKAFDAQKTGAEIMTTALGDDPLVAEAGLDPGALFAKMNQHYGDPVQAQGATFEFVNWLKQTAAAKGKKYKNMDAEEIDQLFTDYWAAVEQ